MRRLTAALAALAALAAVMALSACGEDDSTSQGASPAATETATAVDPGAIMPDDAPPQEEALPPEAVAADEGSGGPCIADFGQDAAEDLVRRCIAVSPATRPPCNVQNPCRMIQDEIDRSCAQYGPGETKPQECEA